MFLYFFLTFSFFLRYFQQEPNTSMRRCEELPWHLQLCRKWGPLKDTIADLKTFEMMYSRYVIVLQFNEYAILTHTVLYYARHLPVHLD